MIFKECYTNEAWKQLDNNRSPCTQLNAIFQSQSSLLVSITISAFKNRLCIFHLPNTSVALDVLSDNAITMIVMMMVMVITMMTDDNDGDGDCDDDGDGNHNYGEDR